MYCCSHVFYFYFFSFSFFLCLFSFAHLFVRARFGEMVIRECYVTFHFVFVFRFSFFFFFSLFLFRFVLCCFVFCFALLCFVFPRCRATGRQEVGWRPWVGTGSLQHGHQVRSLGSREGERLDWRQGAGRPAGWLAGEGRGEAVVKGAYR